MSGQVRIPVEVSLYIYSQRGAISCWTFSIHGAANQMYAALPYQYFTNIFKNEFYALLALLWTPRPH